MNKPAMLNAEVYHGEPGPALVSPQVVETTSGSSGQHAATRRRITAIAKPTHGCNLNCIYCYEGDRLDVSERMTDKTARNLILRLAEYHGPRNLIQIIWHGGEPLLMGIEFYRRVVDVQKSFGADYVFRNCIQTNATLLTDEFLDLFVENHFRIGTSLDGPEWLHNRQRPYPSGQGSFERVFEAIRRILARQDGPAARGVFGGVLAVMTKEAVRNLEAIYSFCAKHHIRLKLSALSLTGRAKGKQLELGITPDEYADALIHLFDIWFAGPTHSIDVDPLDLMLGNLLEKKPIGCQFADACYEKFIAVSPGGTTYPCGRWMSLQDFRSGNINCDTIEEILASPAIQKMRAARAEAALKCRGCSYFQICNSGCADNAHMIRGRLSDKDYYCHAYKRVLSHIEKKVEAELDRISLISHAAVSEQSETVTLMEREFCFDVITHPILRRITRRRLLSHAVPLSSHNVEKNIGWADYEDSYPAHSDYEDYEAYSAYSKYGDYNDYSIYYDA